MRGLNRPPPCLEEKSTRKILSQLQSHITWRRAICNTTRSQSEKVISRLSNVHRGIPKGKKDEIEISRSFCLSSLCPNSTLLVPPRLLSLSRPSVRRPSLPLLIGMLSASARARARTNASFPQSNFDLSRRTNAPSARVQRKVHEAI